jgi:hypothetical protein
MIPCPTCHPRIPATGYRQLEEDVQYDDDETVAYAVAKKKKMTMSGSNIINNDNNNNNKLDDDDDEDWFWECDTCQSTFAMSLPPDNGKKEQQDTDKNKSQQQQHTPLDPPLAAAMHQVVTRVVGFIQDHETLLFGRNKAIGRSNVANNHNDDEDDKETTLILEDLLQEHVTLASNIIGVRHWTTNLLLLLQLDTWLSDIHAQLLTRATATTSKSGNDNDESLLDSVAQSVDALQRLIKFVNGFSSSSSSSSSTNAAAAVQDRDNHNHSISNHDNGNNCNELVLHRGHLLSSVILGTVRALVSLGDAKSQKYASEWLKQLDGGDNAHDDKDNFVTLFESPAMQKVVAALRVAWIRNATVASINAARNSDEGDDNNETDIDKRHSNKKLKKG